MKVGTKSVLIGAHCFFIHPLVLALAWYKLYGWGKVHDRYVGAVSLKNPLLWICFFVHDLGYWGKPNMDGDEGEVHPYWGAEFMQKVYLFFRWNPEKAAMWFAFSLYHSRFLSKRHGRNPSLLCAADKLAIALEPWWFYLPRVWITGEVWEYYSLAKISEGKYAGEVRMMPDGVDPDSLKGWCLGMQRYCRAWAFEHKDGKQDTWTK